MIKKELVRIYSVSKFIALRKSYIFKKRNHTQHKNHDDYDLKKFKSFVFQKTSNFFIIS